VVGHETANRSPRDRPALLMRSTARGKRPINAGVPLAATGAPQRSLALLLRLLKVTRSRPRPTTNYAASNPISKEGSALETVVDYVTAWRLWTMGNQELRNMILWDMPIFWWARVGKVFSLVSGAVIIVDLLGPRRLSFLWIFSTYEDKFSSKLSTALFIGGAITLALAIPTSAFISWGTFGSLEGPPPFSWSLDMPLSQSPIYAISTVYLFCTIFGGVIAYSLVNNKFAPIARVLSLLFLLGGFHFDLLAS
jgi:hypothetical protein